MNEPERLALARNNLFLKLRELDLPTKVHCELLDAIGEYASATMAHGFSRFRELSALPVCERCGEPINSGKICAECLSPAEVMQKLEEAKS